MSASPWRQAGLLTIPLLLLITLTTISLDGPVTANERPRVSEVCTDCHDDVLASLMGSPHQIVEDEFGQPGVRVACTDCHLGQEGHWEEDPEEYPMPSLFTADPTAVGAVCRQCHMNSHQQNMLERNPHTANDVSCTGCHQVHGATHTSLLKDEEVELCYSCHSGVRGQFDRPFRHPVADGVMKCSECHQTLSETRYELSYNGTNAVCYECHREFQGPFPYEHQATVDYSTEGGGCISCHAPHGSFNPRMLRQDFASPDFNVCTQCHSVPLHNMNQQHGTMWSGLPCTDCHADIHGSFTNRNFLRTSLEAEGCFACHQQ